MRYSCQEEMEMMLDRFTPYVPRPVSPVVFDVVERDFDGNEVVSEVEAH